jgi:hypothetical protein
MRPATVYIGALAALGLLVFAGGSGVLAQRIVVPQQFPPEIVPDLSRDILQVDPKHFSVEYENARVRVLRGRIGADESVPMHDAHDGVLVAITECHLRFTRPDKDFIEVHLEPGKVRWIYADTFSGKNLSNAPAEFLFVETKSRG